MKIYVAAVEELTKRKWQDEIQFCELNPHLMLMYFFLQVFKNNLTPCMTKLRVWVLCFPYFMNNYDF